MKHRNIYAVGVALVGLFLFMLVGIAGTMTFTNDSGAVATGIKVEFSANATITWHSGEFSAQDPSGFGKEFTFSGGEVKPGETFTISWGPSTAEVVSHKWEVAASATSTSATSTTIPETPLTTVATSGGSTTSAAQPTAPLNTNWDAITLTDLQGNKVVYDNDGIKINFPPGFDMSKVGEIHWYRNGTYLPWLDDKLEITNSEMKTFKGDEKAWSGYGWHRKLVQASPPSSTDDHAIDGYIYGAAIFPKGWDGSFNWVAAKEALTTTVESTFKWHPKEVWAEIDEFIFSVYKYPYEKFVQFFKELKHDGFTGITLSVEYYMMTPYDNEVLELKHADKSIMNWNLRTPTQNEIEIMLKAAQEAGLDAHVRGVIYISQKYQDEHGFRCSSFIDPTNPKKFFDNYTKLWLKLTPLLNKYHVKLITPFTEMDSIEKYPDLIKEMYTKISEHFDGEMGFEEATANILNGTSVINDIPIHTERAYANFERNFTFWDWVSPDGKHMRYEYSFWTPKLETQKDQRVSVMTPNFVKFLKPAHDYYSSTYPEDPQMFGEIGVYDADGVSLGPAYWDITNKVFDQQEVADIWYAYLKGAKELGIDSLNIWSIPLCDNNTDKTPGEFYLNTGENYPESPAYRVITSIIGPDTSTSE